MILIYDTECLNVSLKLLVLTTIQRKLKKILK